MPTDPPPPPRALAEQLAALTAELQAIRERVAAELARAEELHAKSRELLARFGGSGVERPPETRREAG